MNNILRSAATVVAGAMATVVLAAGPAAATSPAVIGQPVPASSASSADAGAASPSTLGKTDDSWDW